MATEIANWKDQKERDHNILIIGSEEPYPPLKVGVRKAEFIIDNIKDICEFVTKNSKDENSKKHAYELYRFFEEDESEDTKLEQSPMNDR